MRADGSFRLHDVFAVLVGAARISIKTGNARLSESVSLCCEKCLVEWGNAIEQVWASQEL